MFTKYFREAAGWSVVRCLFVLFLAGLSAQSGFAWQTKQEEQPSSTAAAAKAVDITAETVQSRLKQVEENKELDEAVKSKAVETYKQALEQLRVADEHVAKAVEWEKLLKEAPQRVEKLQQELSAPAPAPQPEYPSDASLVQLEQLAARAEEQLTAAKKELSALEAEPKRRLQRRADVPKRLQQLKQRLSELATGLATMPPAGEAPELTLANQTLLLATKRALEQEIKSLEQEVPAYDGTVELLSLDLKAVNQRVTRLESLVKDWRQLVEQRRGSEADKQLRIAQQTYERLSEEGYPDALLQIAEENVTLAERRTGPDGLAARIKQAATDHELIESRLRKLNEDRKSVEEKLKIPGIEDIIGPLLLTQQRELPIVRRRQRKIRARQSVTSKIRLEQITVQERISELGDLEARKEQMLNNLRSRVPVDRHDELEAETDRLLKFHQKILESLKADYASYSNKLVDMSIREQQLVADTEEFAQLINKHILWVRSTDWMNRPQLIQSWRAALWLGNPQQWISVGDSALLSAEEQPVFIGIFLLALILLIWKRMSFRRRLRQLGETTGKSYTEPFLLTTQAALLTLLLALPWPALMWSVGTALASSLEATEFARVVGASLRATAYAYLTLELIRQLCRTQGLAESHFRWNRRRLILLRRHLRWFTIPGLAAVFLVAVFEYEENDDYTASLGRLALMTGLILLALFISGICRPLRAKAPASQDESHAVAAKKPPRWHTLGYLIAVLAPLILAVLAGFGYHYTSMQLTARVIQTGWLVLALVVANAFVVRWLYLVRGRLALEQLQKQREAEESSPVEEKSKEDQEVSRKSDDQNESPPVQPTERVPAKTEKPPRPATDLAAVNEQTRRLVKFVSGFLLLLFAWFIWRDVLPALKLLDQELWSTTFETTRMVQGADNIPRPETFPEVKIITIGNLILALAVVVIAFVASKNLPGLLEVALLRHLPFDSGGRYAISTLARYSINIVGIIIAFNMIGISWSKIQWLAAAMTFGLAFGMQEVFANFVSGIILFLERPIRVGDITTVGDVTGTVTRIRIRATTIQDWDRKEFIVPNKELITGRLLNWTLTDQINRIVINVGIAYGSDTDRALAVLREIADNHPNVLKEPAPLITFDTFGDSTLNLVMRAYLETLMVRLVTITDINSEIHRRFADEGIEIAFPQRDLHIRSSVPIIESGIHSDAAKGNGRETPAPETVKESQRD